MNLFSLKRQRDPFTARARALNTEIAALEEQIQKLHTHAALHPPPRLRSTALPHGQTLHAHPPPPPREPIFEKVPKSAWQNQNELLATPEHYNDLGVRKYDVLAAWRRFANHLRGPAASNPKLVNYLAAGSIHGLRPLRYEKRVARNRLLLLVIVLIVVLTGIFAAYFKHH